MNQRDKIKEILKSMEMEETYERYVKDLSEPALSKLLEELEKVNRKRIMEHRRMLLEHKKGVKFLSLEDLGEIEGKEPEGELEEIGMDSLKNGEWADAILAGGAGTRFFSELGDMNLKSKGLFPITPLGRHSFLEFFLCEILSTGISCRRLPLCLIMTSSITDEEIRRWLMEEEIFGFPKDAIIVFRQEEHPRLDDDGCLIVLEDGSLAWTGDGHGGIFRALLKKRNGESVLDRISKEGIRHIVIHNVDNILSRPFELRRLGFHINGDYLFTTSCVERKEADEKMGIVSYLKKEKGYGVIEYSVCSPEIMKAEKPDGRLTFNAGHINTNLVSISAIREEIPLTLYTGKPVKIGERIVMSSSLELLNQSLIHILPKEKVGICMVKREKFFSPTKSVKGKDSVAQTRKNLSAFFSSLLKECGAYVDEGAIVELNPCCGLRKEDLKEMGLGEGWFIGRNSSIYISAKFGQGSPPFGRGLIIDNEASFIFKVKKPFGNLRYFKIGRFIQPDLETAGMVRLGKDVRISKGVRVYIEIEEGGLLEVEDCFEFSKSFEIKVGKGERRVLRRKGFS